MKTEKTDDILGEITIEVTFFVAICVEATDTRREIYYHYHYKTMIEKKNK